MESSVRVVQTGLELAIETVSGAHAAPGCSLVTERLAEAEWGGRLVI